MPEGQNTEDALIADCVEAPAAASARRHSLHQSSVSCAEMGREMGAAPGPALWTRDVGRLTPAVSRPVQGRVPESGQGECHAASFFPRLLPPASGAEMQIGDAGGGRGGAGVGWGEVTDFIHRTHLAACVAACNLLVLGPRVSSL